MKYLKSQNYKRYLCDILRAVDGDTFQIRVNLDFDFSLIIRIRVAGIDCSEMRDKDQLKHERAMKAFEFAKTWQGKSGHIFLHGKDKYGRYVCDLMLGSENYSETLLSLNLADKYEITLF